MSDTKRDDGGPCTPTVTESKHKFGQDSESVFYSHTGGLTIRDYFAGQWLAGLAATNIEKPNGPVIVREALMIADEYLKARAEQ